MLRRFNKKKEGRRVQLQRGTPETERKIWRWGGEGGLYVGCEEGGPIKEEEELWCDHWTSGADPSESEG